MSRTVVIRSALPLLAALLLVLPTIRVAGAAARASNDFGVNIAFFGDADKQAKMMAAAGISWVRVDLAWSSAEPQAGRYDFTIWDRFVDAFEPYGIHALFILDYGNRLYEGGLPPSTPAGRAAFAAYAGAAAEHFRGRAAWEIWNEPNLPQFWAGAPDPAAYVALARAAAAEIHRADRRALVLGPALGGGTFDYAYLNGTFNEGLLDIVDAVSVHPYGASTPEAATAFYDEIRRRMVQHAPGRDLPIIVSEWGYPVEGLGAAKQADYVLRAINTNRKSGIPLTIWYNWQEPITPWHSFGLLDVRGRPKPAYDALVRQQAEPVRRVPPRP